MQYLYLLIPGSAMLAVISIAVQKDPRESWRIEQLHRTVAQRNCDELHFNSARARNPPARIQYQAIVLVAKIRQIPHHQAPAMVFQRFASALTASYKMRRCTRS